MPKETKMASQQYIFSPINYGFQWTNGWYTFNREAAQKEALKARNLFAKEEKKRGRKVVNFSLPGQLITRGGIGSGHPQIEVVVNVYGCNVY